jgi:small GTP-binding protein
VTAAYIPTLKIIVAGDGNIGKTSLIRRYCEGKFEISRVATIGVDFQTHTVDLPDGTVKLSIWDVAGQTQWKSARESFYRGARATALVYDITNPESFAHLPAWHQEVVAIAPDQRFVVIGNKVDLDRKVDIDSGRRFASSIRGGYVETSALNGEGVDQMFTLLAGLAHEG